MEKVLLILAIKNIFSSLGAKTTDDNYAVGLLDKTTAEPKGLMGMSALGSLLGVNGFTLNTNKQSETVNVGYGIIIVGNVITDKTTLYTLYNGKVARAYGDQQSDLSFASSSEYSITLSTANNTTFDIMVIGR